MLTKLPRMAPKHPADRIQNQSGTELKGGIVEGTLKVNGRNVKPRAQVPVYVHVSRTHFVSANLSGALTIQPMKPVLVLNVVGLTRELLNRHPSRAKNIITLASGGQSC